MTADGGTRRFPHGARKVWNRRASRPLPSVPTKVRLLNRLPTLDLRGADYSSCPEAAIGETERQRLSRVGSSHSFPRDWSAEPLSPPEIPTDAPSTSKRDDFQSLIRWPGRHGRGS